jgi:hypothetical protein
MKKHYLILIITIYFSYHAVAQDVVEHWNTIKASTNPVVAASISDEYETSYKLPLSDYGWEDGIHISRDGLHLYALYFPGDLFGWSMFFLNNLTNLSFCELVGNLSYMRDYANTYGMDFETNMFGCDSFNNVDILYSNRASVDDDFTEWQLSGIARPGLVEGGPMPLFSETNPGEIDIFLFTGNSDIWMIKNTTANPIGIETAIRLPEPINPPNNEFNADNPHLERLDDESLLLVYEKYTDFSYRDFVYSFSYDDGETWTEPIAMTTINPDIGHIEHPHLYKDSNGEWWMYHSIECDIYRSKQTIENNWDSWTEPELIISKGNSPCIGEPTVTNDGDIVFALAYHNAESTDTTDVYDLDPWILRKKNHVQNPGIKAEIIVNIYPNPASDFIKIESSELIQKYQIVDLSGRFIETKRLYAHESIICINQLSKGNYIIKIFTDKNVIAKQVVKI